MKLALSRIGLARLLIGFVVAMLMGTAPAHASWWNNDWKYRKTVTVDTTPSGVNMTGPVGRAVVLIRLTQGNFSFDQALKNGADLRIVDGDDKTPLKYHVESFDAANGIANVWVEVPALNGGEKKKLFIYFGNDKAPVGEDIKGTFDPDYLLVYHFSESAGQPAGDKTANANNSASPVVSVNDASVIGRGARFVGQGALMVNDSPSLAMPAGGQFTVSAWVKPAQLTGQVGLLTRGTLSVGLNNGVVFATLPGAQAQSKTALKQGSWNFVAVTDDGTALKIYIDGVEAASVPASMPALSGAISIANGFNGEMDELRLSKVARPANLMLASANAEGPGAKLVNVDETAEEQGAGGGVLFFILSKVQTLDAVIIGLCLSLLVAALGIMVWKGRYLNAADRHNKLFMKRFAAMHEELVPLDAIAGITPAEIRYISASPLGHLYNVGIEELEIRRRVAQGRALSDAAVAAMRAAVDAVVVEENHKLDKWMVILTIAISGGPFIGLLGTVIGVMSTFGGVAMAGDVNVNAIAPGIAAALLATISGLAAAIPSLFGYNYLNSRITTTADGMRVFVDRLVTRFAEMQADKANPPPFAEAAE